MIRTVIKYTDNKILCNDAEVFEISKQLFPGVYEIELNNYGQFDHFRALKTPKIFDLMPSCELNNLQEYVDKFLSPEYASLCKTAGIQKRTGILLYGEAGIGKSNYTNYIIDKCIKEHEACVFNIDHINKFHALIPKIKELRDIQNTLFIVVFEELDELFKASSSAEGALKNFMDGINSIDNVLFIATTNYLDTIPKSLTNRPSRFKKVLEIKASDNVELMKEWLSKTYKVFIPDITKEECELMHEKCFNKTIDEIKHTLLDYKMDIHDVNKKPKMGFRK